MEQAESSRARAAPTSGGTHENGERQPDLEDPATSEALDEARLARLGRLTAGVAHDFNNILAVVAMRLERLAGRNPDESSQADIGHAEEALAGAARMVSDLMTIGRPGPGRREQAIDLDAHLWSMRHLVGDLLGPDVMVELQLGAAQALVPLSEARLSQVVANLAVNARDSMTRGGLLRITSQNVLFVDDTQVTADGPPLPPGEYVRVDVKDTGQGIDPEVLPRIFEPFFSTKARGLGSGLGLATIHDVIGQAGGAITVESALGRGTTFTFLLPAAREDARGQEQVHGQRFDATRPDDPLVLLVEDEAELRRLLADELRDRGYRVLEAPDGRTALHLANPAVEVLVTDLMIPDPTGPELARRLQAERPELPVVFMTGQLAELVEDQIPEDSLLLIKPFSGDNLDAALRTVLPPH